VATDLAPVADGDITASQSYQELLTDCQEIREQGRRNLIAHFWTLGERIAKELPADHEDRYGHAIILGLEQDLPMDRTTLWRAVKLYQTYDQASILDTRSTMLTWRKLRMLLPLPDEMRKMIEDRIYSGELRTDEDVRMAIQMLKQDMGLLPPPPARSARNQFILAGFDEDLIRKPLSTIWNKQDPVHRAMLLTALIPTLELDQEERPQALEVIGAMRRQLNDYEKGLGRGHES